MSSYVVAALCAGLFSLSLTLDAAAQITRQPLKLTLKGAKQDAASSDYKPGKVPLDSGKVFTACAAVEDDKTTDLYLYVQCGNQLTDLNANFIAAIDTSPLAVYGNVGQLTFSLPIVMTTANDLDVLKKYSLPVELEIDCGQVDVLATGIADVTFTEVDGEVCPDKIKAKLTGIASYLGDVLLVDDGSSLSAGKSNPDVPVPK